MDREILFRLNAGKKYGLGHLSRNLVLQRIFLSENYTSKFLIKTDDSTRVLSFLRGRGGDNIDIVFCNDKMTLNEDLELIGTYYNSKASFLILDHYDHDVAYQDSLKEAGIRWAQFDYKKNENIKANLVINPNLGVGTSDYSRLTSGETPVCAGEKYAIIDESFRNISIQPESDKVLIAMGGGNYPSSVIELIQHCVEDLNFRFDVITSLDLFKFHLSEETRVVTHKNPRKIAEIYASNSVAIVAGGVTTYELSYLGIPMIIVPYADNQRYNAVLWAQSNQAISYSSPEHFESDLRNRGLELMISDLLSVYQHRSVVDGFGAERIVELILTHGYEKI